MNKDLLLIMIALCRLVTAQGRALACLGDRNDAGFGEAMTKVAQSTEELSDRLSRLPMA